VRASARCAKLRLPYRILILEQGFVIVHAHISKFEPEGRPTLRLRGWAINPFSSFSST
jgi:hypothetical protein